MSDILFSNYDMSNATELYVRFFVIIYPWRSRDYDSCSKWQGESLIVLKYIRRGGEEYLRHGLLTTERNEYISSFPASSDECFSFNQKIHKFMEITKILVAIGAYVSVIYNGIL